MKQHGNNIFLVSNKQFCFKNPRVYQYAFCESRHIVQVYLLGVPLRSLYSSKPTYLSCRHEGFQFKQTFVGDICVPESGCQNISNICCINLGNTNCWILKPSTLRQRYLQTTPAMYCFAAGFCAETSAICDLFGQCPSDWTAYSLHFNSIFS